MELWAKIGDQKVKFQGSFRSVMEQLIEKAKDKDTSLLSFHTGQKERRRFKREYRAHGKNLIEMAKSYLVWSYMVEIRKLNQKVKELNKKRKLNPKKANIFQEEINQLNTRIKELKEKIDSLCK